MNRFSKRSRIILLTVLCITAVALVLVLILRPGQNRIEQQNTEQAKWIGGDFTVDDNGNFACYVDDLSQIPFAEGSPIPVSGFVFSISDGEEETRMHLSRISYDIDGRGKDVTPAFMPEMKREDVQAARHDLEAVGTTLEGGDQGAFLFTIPGEEVIAGNHQLTVLFTFGRSQVVSLTTTLNIGETGEQRFTPEDGEAWMTRMGYQK